MKKILSYTIVLIFSLIYGVLIGKYEFFPYGILKSFDDYFEKETKIEEEEILNIQISPESLISVSANNLDSIQIDLNAILFGSPTLPDNLPDTIFEIQDKEYSDLIGLEKIEQFEILMDDNVNSIGYIFNPKESNNRIVIYHQGHRGDFLNGKSTIRYFVERGFTVYAFCMPLLGKNNQPIIHDSKLGEFRLSGHERLKFLDNPLKYFISPVISMINYAESKKYDEITMIGISGGGWTTTLAAAADTRITNSFPVAGTYPMYIRFQKPIKNYGDFEQTYEKLYSRINYLDMYIMGSIGEHRKQIQVLNKYDPCCFNGNYYESYDYIISQKVGEFEKGYFDVFIDSTHFEHKISDFALTKINDVMNSAPNKK